MAQVLVTKFNGVIASVHAERRTVVGDNGTLDRCETVARVVVDVLGPNGARPDVCPTFALPLELWGVEPACLGKRVEVTIEVSGLSSPDATVADPVAEG